METDIRETLAARGICVVIPTYNNAATLSDVIRGCRNYCNDIIVVNDGSTDQTADILQGEEGITTVSYARNRGKGYALKTGFRKALSMGFAYAITIDSDGQHYPSDIERFLRANKEHPGKLILGSRNLSGVARSTGSGFANQFSNFWFFVQTGKKLSDTQTGYRLYPLKKLRGLSLLTSRYEAELELLVFASWHGVELAEEPIEVFYPRPEERVSHFRPWKDFARISILNTVLCGLAVIYGYPLLLWRWASKYLRTLFAILFVIVFLMFIITPGVWIYMKMGPVTEKKRWNIHRLIHWFSRTLMLRIGIPGTTFSHRNDVGESFEQPSVVICNHQSHFDLMCQLLYTPKMVFLTNQWVWHNPLYGLIIQNAEFYPVADGIDALMPRLRSLIDRGYHIAVYPEGTRSADCRIGRFHQGAFHIAEALNVDILPMFLYGSGKVLPKKKHTLRKWAMYIEVGERISPEEMKAMGTTLQQASRMRAVYAKRYTELCNMMEQNV